MTKEQNIAAPPQGTEPETPPIFKTWKRFYSIVAFNLLLLIILFYAFTKAFE